MYWQLNEVKVTQPSAPTDSEILGLVDTDRMLPTGLGFIQDNETERDLLKNTRVLARRSITLRNPSVAGNLQRTFSFNIKFKKPKLIRYAADDDDGEKPINRFFWHGFCCQGIGDTVNQGQPPGASGISPMICANVVLRYHEKLD